MVRRQRERSRRRVVDHALVGPVPGQRELNLVRLLGLTRSDRERQSAMFGRVAPSGLTIVCGPGTHFVCEPDLLVYADLARWEAQMRFRRDEISNLGVENRSLKWSLQYKRAFFVDWRVADRNKKRLPRKRPKKKPRRIIPRWILKSLRTAIKSRIPAAKQNSRANCFNWSKKVRKKR